VPLGVTAADKSFLIIRALIGHRVVVTFMTLMVMLIFLGHGGDNSNNAKGHNESNESAHVQVSSVERNRSYFISEGASSLLSTRYAATGMVNEVLILI
jgi:hypothetical protein